MAQQTINVGAAPNDGTGTPLRTAFQYTNSNFSELYTATGPSGNNITVPGTATISGDLTVDTSTLKVVSASDVVGINTASPLTGTDAGLTIGAIGTVKALNIGLQNTFARLREKDALDAFAITTNMTALNTQDDATKSSWKARMGFGNGNDNFIISRSGVGSTTFYDLLSVSTGSCVWYDGAGGTRMTLNATGLGVGASPLSASKLTLNGGTGDTSSQDSIFSLIRTSSNGNVLTGKVVLAQKTTDFGNIVFRIKTTASSAENPAYYTNALTIDGENGNVGIGVTPSAWGNQYRAIQIFNNSALYGANSYGYYGLLFNGYNDNTNIKAIASLYVGEYRYELSTGAHKWFGTTANATAGATATPTQAMTLDASGRLLVGTANASVTSETGCRLLLNNGATGHFTLAVTTNQSTAATSCYDFYSTSAAAYRFYVTSAGVINATNTTISAISDARLKENVQDIDVGLGAILALKPRKFDWKAGKGKDIKGDRGFIAQEFEQVFPNLIDEWKDPAPEGEAPYKSVRQDLIPVLVKAIQELAAEVNALKNA